MEAYTGFAAVYDEFMDNVPYEEWGGYLIEALKKENIQDGLVLDLGCGTGKMTRFLAKSGYDMIGVDMSEEMLMIAGAQESEGILYLCQDMREFELYGTVRAVISVCDCLNYILEPGELREVFRLVNNYLDPGGVFIFDMNTPYKYQELLADNVFAEARDECSFIWDNVYDEDEKINEYALTLFVEEGECYRRFDEIHYQRSYTANEIQRLIAEAGMEFVAIYDAYTLNALRDDSERMTIIAREKGKRTHE